jgi:hypothetical protein
VQGRAVQRDASVRRPVPHQSHNDPSAYAGVSARRVDAQTSHDCEAGGVCVREADDVRVAKAHALRPYTVMNGADRRSPAIGCARSHRCVAMSNAASCSSLSDEPPSPPPCVRAWRWCLSSIVGRPRRPATPLFSVHALCVTPRAGRRARCERCNAHCACSTQQPFCVKFLLYSALSLSSYRAGRAAAADARV